MLNSTHTKKNRGRKKWGQRWKSVAQVNEQCCIRKGNGGLKKQNRCKICKQQNKLFKMDIRTNNRLQDI